VQSSGEFSLKYSRRPLRGLFAVLPDIFELVYGGDVRDAIERQVEIIGGPLPAEDLLRFPRLDEVEIMFTGWYSPRLEGDYLKRMPRLKAVFHGGGTINFIVSDEFWERDIPISSAYHANSIPVAEFSQAAILMSLKKVWGLSRLTKEERRWSRCEAVPGAYHSVVGLLSLGAIGRLVAERLRTSSLEVIAYDPFVNSGEAARLGVRMVSLPELFMQSDVVSIHVPLLRETRGMVTGALLESMKRGATLLNTARGAVIREAEMIDVLSRRPDLTAVLDVVETEPLPPDSPLYDLPNVVLTPHMAGSVGPECRRMGAFMSEELSKFRAGQPLSWRITPEQCARMA
jgi:phosphoglycerate dehydrogenase-like enzyme